MTTTITSKIVDITQSRLVLKEDIYFIQDYQEKVARTISSLGYRCNRGGRGNIGPAFNFALALHCYIKGLSVEQAAHDFVNKYSPKVLTC